MKVCSVEGIASENFHGKLFQELLKRYGPEKIIDCVTDMQAKLVFL